MPGPFSLFTFLKEEGSAQNFRNLYAFGSSDFDRRKMVKTLLSGSKIILLLSSNENINFDPSILSSALSKYEPLGNSAVNVVLPDSDLHVKVATGSPGRNEVSKATSNIVVKNFRIRK